MFVLFVADFYRCSTDSALNVFLYWCHLAREIWEFYALVPDLFLGSAFVWKLGFLFSLLSGFLFLLLIWFLTTYISFCFSDFSWYLRICIFLSLGFFFFLFTKGMFGLRLFPVDSSSLECCICWFFCSFLSHLGRTFGAFCGLFLPSIFSLSSWWILVMICNLSLIFFLFLI